MKSNQNLPTEYWNIQFEIAVAQDRDPAAKIHTELLDRQDRVLEGLKG